MKGKISVILAAIVLICYNAVFSAGWELIWQDEFNDGISQDWSFDTGYGSWGWGNDEWQFYTPDNAFIVDSALVIRATCDGVPGLRDGSIKSAKLITRGNFDVKYGKIEARMKMLLGKGCWPAFWMLGANINTVGWPKCGEIDIMENVNAENVIHGTAHWDDNGRHDSYGQTIQPVNIDEFHLYSIIWDEQLITWQMDGETYCTMDITADALREFHENFYIILNLAIGGVWPGSPDTTTFPAEIVVDYVRVFRHDGPRIGFYPAKLRFEMEKAGALAVDPQTINITNTGSETLTDVTVEADVDWLEIAWIDQQGNDQSFDVSINEQANEFPFGSYSAELTVNAENTAFETIPVELQIGKNLVLRNVVRASSVEADPPDDENVEPINVNDGDKSTRWASEWSDPQWISIDLNRIFLNKQFSVESVKLFWEDAYADEYEIQLSNTSDFSSYEVIANVMNNDGGIDLLMTDNSVAGRYIRMYGISRATEYGYSLYEFEVYGSVSTGVSENDMVAVPENYQIQNAPNPFNPNTTVYYSLPEKQKIKLAVYDINGKMVKTLFSGVQEAGQHKIVFDGKQLASGMYLCRLETPMTVLTRKMLLVK